MDLSHTWGRDLATSPYGDLATSTGTQEAIETVTRYLMTSPGDDPFNAEFGFGAGAQIGEVLSATKIKALILAGLRGLDVVAATPSPTVSTHSDGLGSVIATIQFNVAASGATAVIGPLSIS